MKSQSLPKTTKTAKKSLIEIQREQEMEEKKEKEITDYGYNYHQKYQSMLQNLKMIVSDTKKKNKDLSDIFSYIESGVIFEVLQYIESKVITMLQQEVDELRVNLSREISTLKKHCEFIWVGGHSNGREFCVGSEDQIKYYEICHDYETVFVAQLNELATANCELESKSSKYSIEVENYKKKINELFKQLQLSFSHGSFDRSVEQLQFYSSLLTPSVDLPLKYLFLKTKDCQQYLPSVCWGIVAEFYLDYETNDSMIQKQIKNKYKQSCKNNCCFTFQGVCFKKLHEQIYK